MQPGNIILGFVINLKPEKNKSKKMEIFGYVALIGIGLVLGLLGSGGSMLSIPVLVYLFSMDVVAASSYSLFIVGITSIMGVWLKQKNQMVDIPSGMLFGGTSVVAIFVVRHWILPNVPEVILVNTFQITKRMLILTVFAALVMISAVVGIVKGQATENQSGSQRKGYLLPIGFVTGLVVGFVGAGGGFLILPALLVFGRLPFRAAVGTTLLVIVLNSLTGFAGDALSYSLDWQFLTIVTSLAMGGMLLGNFTHRRIPVYHLRLSFSWLMLTLGVWILTHELFDISS